MSEGTPMPGPMGGHAARGAGSRHGLAAFRPTPALPVAAALPPLPRAGVELRTTAELVRAAAALGRAVVALHARGIVHGGIHPANVAAGPDGTLVLRAAEVPFRADPADPVQTPRLAFAAPELLRGAKPSRRSDAFALAATIHALAAGPSPFDAGDPLETIRRVLHEEPVRLASVRGDVPAALEAVLARALAKRAWKRASAEDIVEVAEEIGRGLGGSILAVAGATAGPTDTAGDGAESHEQRAGARVESPLTLALSPAHAGARAIRATSRLASRAAAAAAPLLARLERHLPPPLAGARLRLVALAAIPVLALALLVFPDRDGSLAERVADLLERGAIAEARAALDDAARERPGDPLVEKLRGDVACARGAPGECLRRYRVALAARPAFRGDETLRVNARTLLGRGRTCSDRRAAAELLGELRDPGALPALEHARRTAGIFAYFCTGSAVERAIVATKAELARGGSPARR